MPLFKVWTEYDKGEEQALELRSATALDAAEYTANLHWQQIKDGGSVFVSTRDYSGFRIDFTVTLEMVPQMSAEMITH